MVGPLVSAQILSETDPSITYTGTWTTAPDTNALGGQVMDSIQPGATATVQFMGRNIAWIAPRGSTPAPPTSRSTAAAPSRST